MTQEPTVLVLPDRDSAEEVAELLVDQLGMPEEPRVVREALAGEDDAEDAQWLIIVPDLPQATWPIVDTLLREHDGWRETG